MESPLTWTSVPIGTAAGELVVHQVPTVGVGLLSRLRHRVFGGPNVEDEEVDKLLQLIIAAGPVR